MGEIILRQLNLSGLFRKFPADFKQRLADQSHSRKLQDGDIVYRPGDTPEAFHGVLTGVIKMTGEDPSGKYFLYGLIQPGWWFGEISVLDGHPRAQLATAIGETEILVIPRSALIAELDADPSLYKVFVDVLCTRLRQAGVVFEETAFLTTPIRLGKHLLRLHQARESFRAKLSQEEIAASLGVTRQSIHRVLKDWQRYGWVEVGYGDIQVLEPDQIEAFIARQAMGSSAQQGQ